MFSPNSFDSRHKKNKKPIVYKHFIRKFPGPAGLAPDLPPGEIEKLLSEESGLRGFSNNGILLGSTYSCILLNQPTYLRLIDDYGLNENNNPLNHLTLQMVSKAFIRKGKKDMKVPFLGLLVSAISQEHGISLKLMDPTHEVNAVVHQNVWDEIGSDVKMHSAIALTQVPVIASCTVRPPITLFISKKNVLTLFIETGDGHTDTKTINTVPEQELKKSCVEWLTQMGVNPFGKASPDRSEPRSSPDSGPPSKPASNQDEDFFKGLDLTIDDFETSSFFSSSSETGRRNLSAAAQSEDFTPKRAKIDLNVCGGKSPFFRERRADSSEFGRAGERTSGSGDVRPGAKDAVSPQRMDSQSQELSQSEKLMVEEVLNGINFDDFDS